MTNPAAQVFGNDYLRNRIFALTRSWTGDEAAAAGNVFVLREWGHELPGFTDDALVLAAQSGNLDAVRWVYENRPGGCVAAAMDAAAEAGNKAVLEWLNESPATACAQYSRWEMMWAIANDRMEVVHWLLHHC